MYGTPKVSARSRPDVGTINSTVHSADIPRGPSLIRAAIVSMLLSILLFTAAGAQTGGTFTIYGDLKVDESKVSGLKPMTFEVTLQSQRLTTMGRQTVPKDGQFRFENLSSGIYYIVVMLEGTEVANVRVRLN